MITEFLRRALRRYANVDANLDELRMIIGSEGGSFADEFRRDLTTALQSRSLTPDIVDEIMMRDFDDQSELDLWLRNFWSSIFKDIPYPAGA